MQINTYGYKMLTHVFLRFIQQNKDINILNPNLNLFDHFFVHVMFLFVNFVHKIYILNIDFMIYFILL